MSGVSEGAAQNTRMNQFLGGRDAKTETSWAQFEVPMSESECEVFFRVTNSALGSVYLKNFFQNF